MDRVGPPLLLPPLPQRQLSLVALLEQLIVDVTNSSSGNSCSGSSSSSSSIVAADPAAAGDGIEKDDTSVDHDDDDDGHLKNKKQQQQRQRRLVVIECLLRKEHVPIRQRNLIEELVEEFDNKMNKDVHAMITELDIWDDDTYNGLDSNRDTHDEVETVLRILPDVIGKRTEDDEYDDGDYPIQCLACNFFNLNTIPFVHLFARLAIEFNSFNEDARGGLLPGDDAYDLNVFENLTCSSRINTTEGQRRADEIRTTEFIRLRRMGLMVVDDIRQYGLIERLIVQKYFPECYEHSARFLIEWCPDCLLPSTLNDREAPLMRSVRDGSLQSFRFIFEYLIRYYPYKRGISLLFQNNIRHWWAEIMESNRNRKRIPYEVTRWSISRDPLKHKKAMGIVEDILSRYSRTTPINTRDALIAAAIDPEIHLDGVYFLMRREPDVLISMVKSSKLKNDICKDDDTCTIQDTITNNNNSSADGESGKRNAGTKRKNGDTNDYDDANDISNNYTTNTG